MTGRTAAFTVVHRSAFEYSEPAGGSVMLVRLSPLEDRGQRLRCFRLDVEPPGGRVAFRDGFGNRCHLLHIHRRYRRAEVTSRAEVVTASGREPPDRLDPERWDAVAGLARDVRFWHFLAPSRYTRPSEALTRFARRHGIERGRDPLSTLREACTSLYGNLRYTPGQTHANSTIDEILATGAGVCQDYAHVMIALARSWGIPARYVSGYLHLGVETAVQDGASHAWPEFWLPEIGWLGFDPTHDRIVDERHVRLAHGRDYGDAAPTRGAVYGGGSETLRVRVSIRDRRSGTHGESTEWPKPPPPDASGPAASGQQ